jgi:predicted AlkP superfamily phosphohydrolase/phosphomutase
MSDHGFRSTDKLLNLKEVLQQFGFLRTNTYATARLTNRARLRRWLGPIRHWIPQSKKSPHKLGSVAEMGDIDWSNTRAYIRTAASQGIVINMKGREPHGIVAPGPESEALLQEIETRLLSLRDPETGEVVIKEVARGSELYQGDYTDNASDLLVIPADGYCQTEAEKGPHLMPLRMNTGIHSLDGIFVANGPGINQKATITGATLMDIAPTILYLSDVAIPRSMDGHVLDIFSNHCLTQQPPRYVELDSELEKQSYDYTEEEEQQLEEHLRSLGYL